MKIVAGMGLTAVMALSLVQCTEDPYAALARAHAPKHFQDTDSTSYTSDMLTAVDYDGNYVGTDNWDNLAVPATWTTGTNAVVYRSVVETCTHHFIVYAMFHPRDWSDNDVIYDEEHENDMEGVLVAVTNDGSANGRVDGMVTVFHNDFYSYTPAGSAWTDGVEDIDGTLSFATVDGTPHPITSQEAKGHGMKAWPYAGDFAGNAGEDGITYLPGDVSERPPSGNARDVHYTLENLYDELWFLQLTQSAPWTTWGTFAGDESGTCGDGIVLNCVEDSAHAPWAWDDTDDAPYSVWNSITQRYDTFSGLPAGLLALDPARLVEVYFDGLGDFSRDYVSNRYLEDLRANGYTDAFKPAGFPADLSLDEAYTHLGAVCTGNGVAADPNASGGVVSN